MSAPLKPCPFCGGVETFLMPARTHWVRCVSCEACGPISHSREDAITAWNERRDPTAQRPDVLPHRIDQARQIVAEEVARWAHLYGEDSQTVMRLRQACSELQDCARVCREATR